jgi:hypothetical protein
MFEVGKKYQTKEEGEFECIAVTDTHAWMKLCTTSPAYVWTQEGKSVSLNDQWDIKPQSREFWIYEGMVTDVYHANAIHVREVLK